MMRFPKKPRGGHHTVETHLELKVKAEGDYSPSEEQTWHEPGHPECAEVRGVYLQVGDQLIELPQELWEAQEEALEAEIREKAWCDHETAIESQYDAMRDEAHALARCP